jgi:hypothetical protein
VIEDLGLTLEDDIEPSLDAVHRLGETSVIAHEAIVV